MSKCDIKLYEVENIVHYYELDENGDRHEQVPAMKYKLNSVAYQVRAYLPNGTNDDLINVESFISKRQALEYYRQQLKRGFEKEN